MCASRRHLHSARCNYLVVPRHSLSARMRYIHSRLTYSLSVSGQIDGQAHGAIWNETFMTFKKKLAVQNSETRVLYSYRRESLGSVHGSSWNSEQSARRRVDNRVEASRVRIRNQTTSGRSHVSAFAEGTGWTVTRTESMLLVVSCRPVVPYTRQRTQEVCNWILGCATILRDEWIATNSRNIYCANSAPLIPLPGLSLLTYELIWRWRKPNKQS